MRVLKRPGWASAAWAAALALACASPAFARIKLTTLPARQRVEVQLDNAEATLVEEERIVTFLKGSNQVDFSWSNTAIDRGTILLRVVDMPTRAATKEDAAALVRPDGKVEMIRIVNVAYPPGENALVWEVYAEQPFAARVRISYLIGGLRRSFDYRAVAEHDEKTLVLRKFMRLDNFSGEDFGASGIWAGFGNYFQREVGMNEAKQLLMWKFDAVPIKKTYTFDWWMGRQVPDEPDQRYVEMRYVLQNDEKHNMGRFPLQFGKARIFQKDGKGGEAFIGEDWGKFTPIDDKMELYLGLARDVVVKRKTTTNRRHNVNANLYHQEVALQYSIENFKPEAITLDIREDMRKLRDEFCGYKDRNPQWEIVPEGTSIGKEQIEPKDVNTVEFHIPLEGAPKDEGRVKTVEVNVHLFLRNEW
jgi:hypothetical protein